MPITNGRGGIAAVSGRSVDRKTVSLSSFDVPLSPAAEVLVEAAKSGTPFCEQCEKAKKEAAQKKKGQSS